MKKTRQTCPACNGGGYIITGYTIASEVTVFCSCPKGKVREAESKEDIS